jgi:hypothetical protein
MYLKRTNRLVNLSEKDLEGKLSRARKLQVFCSKYFLPHTFIEKHLDKFNELSWSAISASQRLSEDFVERHQDKINFDKVFTFYNLEESFIRKYSDRVSTARILATQKLSINYLDEIVNSQNIATMILTQRLNAGFINKHIDKVKEYYDTCDDNNVLKIWYRILDEQKVGTKFIEKYAEYFDEKCWNVLSEKQRMSQSFMIKNMDKVRLDRIRGNVKLDIDFIDNYGDILNWDNIVRYQTLNTEIIDKYADDLVKHYYSLVRKYKLSEEFIEKSCHQPYTWGHTCASQDLSETFMDKHAEHLKWDIVSRHQKMSIGFIAKYSHKLSEQGLRINKKLDQQELEDSGVYTMIKLSS